MNIQTLSPDARKAINLAKEKHWGIRVLESKDAKNPFYKQEWWYIPVDGDDSTIPKKAKERVRFLKSRGIKVKKEVIAHEERKRRVRR